MKNDLGVKNAVITLYGVWESYEFIFKISANGHGGPKNVWVITDYGV